MAGCATQAIIDVRVEGMTLQWKVRWRAKPGEEAEHTWEPLESFMSAEHGTNEVECPISYHTLISCNNISNMLRYLYGKPPIRPRL